MADLILDIFDKAEAGDIPALVVIEGISDIVFAVDSTTTEALLVVDDGIEAKETITASVDIVITDSVTISDIFDYVRRLLHLAKRIFTLRLRE
jgi:hypothetical protein